MLKLNQLYDIHNINTMLSLIEIAFKQVLQILNTPLKIIRLNSLLLCREYSIYTMWAIWCSSIFHAFNVKSS